MLCMRRSRVLQGNFRLGCNIQPLRVVYSSIAPKSLHNTTQRHL